MVFDSHSVIHRAQKPRRDRCVPNPSTSQNAHAAYSLTGYLVTIFTEMLFAEWARTRAHLCVVGLLLFTLAAPLKAQDQSAVSALIGLGGANALSELQARMQDATMQGSSLALEGALDPEEYVLGPGDRFNVGIGGILSNTYSLVVSASGDLDLPEAGQLQAAGRTLAAVTAEALAALRESYANVPVSVSLVQTRSFYVHVSGAVPQPGRYLMLPISRVDEVLAEAFTPKYFDVETNNYIYLPARRPELHAEYEPAFRNVQIQHRDGTTTSIDLVRYYINSETEHNPYLRDGDRIVIPSYHRIRDGVRLSGDIAYGGTYSLRPGDTAKDLLELAAGPSGTAHLDSVRLTRSGDLRPVNLDAQALLGGVADNPVLQAGDHLVARAVKAAIARIQGRVKYPGTYNIEDGHTTIQELIKMAGGLEGDANLEAAFVERGNSLDFRETPSQSDLDYQSRRFFQSFASRPNRVHVDLRSVVQTGSENLVLYDGDRVVFPRDEGTVRVIGQVTQPGAVAYQSGMPASYYIERAGGRAPGSREVYVVEESTGEVHQGANAIVKSGDTIFVDRMSLADDPEMEQLLLAKKQNRIQTAQVILAGVTAITGIITTYVAVFNR